MTLTILQKEEKINTLFIKNNSFAVLKSIIKSVLSISATVSGGGAGGGGGEGGKEWGDGSRVVGRCRVSSPGHPTDVGLQLGKACYPCSR